MRQKKAEPTKNTTKKNLIGDTSVSVNWFMAPHAQSVVHMPTLQAMFPSHHRATKGVQAANCFVCHLNGECG